MTKDESLKLALEALNTTESDCGSRAWEREQEAITAIKEALAQPEQEPVALDRATMELAESVGLIGPASRTHDLHDAIQRFHDLICANATIKAAVAFSRTLEAKDAPVAWKWHQAPVKTLWGHDMVVADRAIDKDNTVSVYCERDQTTKVEAMFTTPPQPEQEPVAWNRGVPPVRPQQKEGETFIVSYEDTHPPQRTEPTCPECKAVVLYECVACSCNNYPPKETT